MRGLVRNVHTLYMHHQTSNFGSSDVYTSLNYVLTSHALKLVTVFPYIHSLLPTGPSFGHVHHHWFMTGWARS